MKCSCEQISLVPFLTGKASGGEGGSRTQPRSRGTSARAGGCAGAPAELGHAFGDGWETPAGTRSRENLQKAPAPSPCAAAELLQPLKLHLYGFVGLYLLSLPRSPSVFAHHPPGCLAVLGAFRAALALGGRG